MSAKTPREDRRLSKSQPVSSRCIAIVLAPVEKEGPASPTSPGSRVGDILVPGLHPEYDEGEQQEAEPRSETDNGVVGFKDDVKFEPRLILEDFKLRNKSCYWNPALVDSVRSLEYMGFLEPHTILVKGDDIHLENIRTAWGRRVLKDPANFSIEKIGDVNGIEMQVIPQTQFIPLPEALCLIIMDLNNNQITATLDTVCERLHHCYQGLQLPSNQLLYDTLGTLIRERKVFHTGSGYFVVTPDTFRFHGDDLRCAHLGTAWTHLHPMYIPAAFSQPYRAPMRSISCQVDVQEACSVIGGREKVGGMEVGLQTQEPVESEWSQPRIMRSQSMCRSREKKNKEECREGSLRRSSSLRGKNDKEKDEPQDVNLKKSNVNQNKNKGEKVSLFAKLFGRGKKKEAPPPPPPAKPQVEYASFSAQFPPPEWLWYQQQIDRQLRTENWVQQQIVKSGTWHHFTTSLPTEGVPEEILPPSLVDCASAPGARGVGYQPAPPKNAVRKSGRKSHKHRDHAPVIIANHPEETIKVEKTKRNSCHDDMLGTAQDKATSGIGFTHVLPTNELLHSRYLTAPMYSSTPRTVQTQMTHHWHQQPLQQPQLPHQGHDLTTEQLTTTPQPTPHIKSSHHSQRRSERKAKKKSHRDRHSSYHPAQIAEDISYEYQGALPQKNNPVGMSRDSGVNCIGLKSQDRHSVSKSRSMMKMKSHRTDREQRETTVKLEREAHVYANVHVQCPVQPPRLPERTHRRSSHDSSNTKSRRKHSGVLLETDKKCAVDYLQVDLPSIDQKSDHNSDRGTVESSRSSQDTGTQDSAIEGSSDHSHGTVINRHAVIHKPLETLISETRELTLGDSGFSSPRTSENTESRKNEQNATRDTKDYLCNDIHKENSLNNVAIKADSVSGDSTGRITPGALYENVKIDNTDVLNNLKYLHKEINVSSQNLNTPMGSQDLVTNGVMDSFDPKQPVVKKFNFDGDFHVVGVV